MNKKYILVATLVVLGALIVSAFGWAAITRSKASASLTPAEIMALRWNAMARYYEAKSAQTGVYAADYSWASRRDVRERSNVTYQTSATAYGWSFRRDAKERFSGGY